MNDCHRWNPNCGVKDTCSKMPIPQSQEVLFGSHCIHLCWKNLTVAIYMHIQHELPFFLWRLGTPPPLPTWQKKRRLWTFTRLMHVQYLPLLAKQTTRTRMGPLTAKSSSKHEWCARGVSHRRCHEQLCVNMFVGHKFWKVSWKVAIPNIKTIILK